jgi:hypothetical protein
MIRCLEEVAMSLEVRGGCGMLLMFLFAEFRRDHPPRAIAPHPLMHLPRNDLTPPSRNHQQIT